MCCVDEVDTGRGGTWLLWHQVASDVTSGGGSGELLPQKKYEETETHFLRCQNCKGGQFYLFPQ